MLLVNLSNFAKLNSAIYLINFLIRHEPFIKLNCQRPIKVDERELNPTFIFPTLSECPKLIGRVSLRLWRTVHVRDSIVANFLSLSSPFFLFPRKRFLTCLRDSIVANFLSLSSPFVRSFFQQKVLTELLYRREDRRQDSSRRFLQKAKKALFFGVEKSATPRYK